MFENETKIQKMTRALAQGDPQLSEDIVAQITENSYDEMYEWTCRVYEDLTHDEREAILIDAYDNLLETSIQNPNIFLRQPLMRIVWAHIAIRCDWALEAGRSSDSVIAEVSNIHLATNGYVGSQVELSDYCAGAEQRWKRFIGSLDEVDSLIITFYTKEMVNRRPIYDEVADYLRQHNHFYSSEGVRTRFRRLKKAWTESAKAIYIKGPQDYENRN